jgi:hypothetical protein
MDPQDTEQIRRCFTDCRCLQPGREELELSPATDEAPRSLPFQPMAEIHYCG